LHNLVKLSWRLADTLGYAAFSPEKQYSWEELVAELPNSKTSWLGESPEAAQAELAKMLAAAPL
jgi:hypothetical protein